MAQSDVRVPEAATEARMETQDEMMDEDERSPPDHCPVCMEDSR